jgi:hypothetical protein
MTFALPSRAVLLACSLAAAACFDVTKVQLPPFTIDDFEDGDLRPRTDRFGDWSCRTFTDAGDDAGTPADPDGGPSVDCTVGAVGNHPFAITMPFAVQDPSDGQRQLGGAELATRATRTSVDLGRFTRLVLSAILESGTSPLPAGTQLRVEIGCPPSGTPTALEYNVPDLVIGSDWATFRLDLANFAPPAPACLREATAIRISVRPGLPDGEATSGALHLDNLYLQ